MLALVAEPSLAQQPPLNYLVLEKVVLGELKETNTPGAAVAIVSGDRVVYAKGFGISNVETGSAVTPEMLFMNGGRNPFLIFDICIV